MKRYNHPDFGKKSNRKHEEKNLKVKKKISDFIHHNLEFKNICSKKELVSQIQNRSHSECNWEISYLLVLLKFSLPIKCSNPNINEIKLYFLIRRKSLKFIFDKYLWSAIGVFFVTLIPWFIYGVVHKDKPIAITYSLSFIANMTVLVGALIY